MHRTTIALASAIIMSAALLSAQGKTETKFRGCLLPGSTQGSFLLTNAVAKDDKTKTKISLKVVVGNTKVNVADRVTQEVEITGTVAPSTTAGQPGTLTATKVAWKADYCG